MRCGDVTFGTGANLYAIGKGRRDRHTPLTPATAKLLRAWLHQRRAEPQDPVFTTRTGGRLSTDAVEDLVDKHVAAATTACPSLLSKRVTPHTLRHYVDGWVMWPAGVFPLLGLSLSPVPAT